MMTTGEKTFSTAGRTVVERKFELIPKGEYEIKLKKAEVRTAKRQGAIPYVAVTAEVLGSATSEGGKNRNVFFNVLCSLKPGADGVISPERENGLIALTRALGTELEDVGVIEREATLADGSVERQEFLDPQAISAWLQTQDGATCRARIGVTKPTKEYPDERNEISRFLPPAN